MESDAQDFATEQGRLKIDLRDARIVIRNNQSGTPDAEVIDGVRRALKEFTVVASADWLHRFHHVASLDATGVIEWPAHPQQLQWSWMLRPGGLATVTTHDETTICLAKEPNAAS